VDAHIRPVAAALLLRFLRDNELRFHRDSSVFPWSKVELNGEVALRMRSMRMSTPNSRTGNSAAKPGGLYRPFLCRLESIRPLTPTEKLFRLSRLDGERFGHKPGQFMQVSVFGYGEAPISVSSSPTRGAYLELGVRRAGTLTCAMHNQLKPGETLGLRGPFGKAFDMDALIGKDLLLISGGCGLAPMRALIQYVEDTRTDTGESRYSTARNRPRTFCTKTN